MLGYIFTRLSFLFFCLYSTTETVTSRNRHCTDWKIAPNDFGNKESAAEALYEQNVSWTACYYVVSVDNRTWMTCSRNMYKKGIGWMNDPNEDIYLHMSQAEKGAGWMNLSNLMFFTTSSCPGCAFIFWTNSVAGILHHHRSEWTLFLWSLKCLFLVVFANEIMKQFWKKCCVQLF